jgi:hypothetical protein
MPTTARTRFEANASDVEHLLEIHELLGGTDPGRRSAQLQVLNKSGIVLICAIWEAYCEDLAAEALDFLVQHVSGPDKLPKSLRKRVAKELESDVNKTSCVEARRERLETSTATAPYRPSRRAQPRFEHAEGRQYSGAV